MRKIVFILCFLFAFILFASCEKDQEHICTERFDTLTVKVVSVDGSTTNNVTNATLTVQNLKTSKYYDIEQSIPFKSEGRYIYLTDNQVSEMSIEKISLKVEGFVTNQGSAEGTKIFSEIFEVNTDEHKCHVQKVSGKDLIIGTLN